MDKKIFSHKLTYLPARLSRKKDRWEIVYYQTDPNTGKRKRHRETWDLNRIQDKAERTAAAKRAVNEINRLLPHGYPWVEPSTIDRKLNGMTLYKALEMAIEIKLKSDKYETTKDVRSRGGVLLEWIKSQKLDMLPAEDFTKVHALKYLDYVATRKTKSGKLISNTTWNNYRNKTGSLFIELIQREIIPTNPFEKISRKPYSPKSRRKFTPEDRVQVAKWLFEYDFFCFLAVSLQYYGLLRGTELRRLRASDVKLDQGIIILIGEKSKTGRDRYVTIPDTLCQILHDSRFGSIPGNYLIFGLGGQPHPTLSCGRSYIWRHLRKCLEELKRTGKIPAIDGLSPYSFKDTGITEWLSCMPVPDVMRQAGHTNPTTTMIYYQPDPVSKSFKGAPSIFDINTTPLPRPISHTEHEK